MNEGDPARSTQRAPAPGASHGASSRATRGAGRGAPRGAKRSEPQRLALENCLHALLSGATLDEALALHPGWEDTLRPLLSAAQAAAALGGGLPGGLSGALPDALTGAALPTTPAPSPAGVGAPAASRSAAGSAAEPGAPDQSDTPPQEAYETPLDRLAAEFSGEPAANAAPDPDPAGLGTDFDRDAYIDSVVVQSGEAQGESRARFLQAARRIGSPARRRRKRAWRLSVTAVISFIVLFVLGSVAWFFSESALPGQALHPLKLGIERARLFLSPSPAHRLELELLFDIRRLEEVRALHASPSPSAAPLPVDFVGILSARDEELWQIGGLNVSIPPEVRIVGQVQEGLAVAVQANLLADGELAAVQIQPRQYALAGRVEAVQPGGWLVAGVPVVLAGDSLVQGEVELGSRVSLVLLLRADGRLHVRLAQVEP